MATYSLAQLEQLWEQAGGSVTTAPTAAAIAYAESGGNPVNPNYTDPNGGSFGLWQVNGVHASALENAGLTNWETDPLQNAEAAVMVYNGAGQNFFSSASWLAEAPGYPGNANYQKAVAMEQAGDLGTPAVWPQNPFQQWFTGVLTGGSGTATAPVAGQAGTAAGTANTTAATGFTNPLGAPIATLQASWSSFWTAHPSWLILAGLVLALMAWAMLSSSNSSVTLSPAGAA